MIITCNSGEKNLQFQITQLLRLEDWFNVVFVEINGNNFLLGEDKKVKQSLETKNSLETTAGSTKNTKTEKSLKKSSPKKQREISLYSPEYLAKNMVYKLMIHDL